MRYSCSKENIALDHLRLSTKATGKGDLKKILATLGRCAVEKYMSKDNVSQQGGHSASNLFKTAYSFIVRNVML